MYFRMEIVELEMEALLEARDIYTTRRPFFQRVEWGARAGGGGGGEFYNKKKN